VATERDLNKARRANEDYAATERDFNNARFQSTRAEFRADKR
jgi:hypothetical protein